MTCLTDNARSGAQHLTALYIYEIFSEVQNMTNIGLVQKRVLKHIVFKVFLVQGTHDTSYSEVLDKFLVKPAHSAK